MKYRMLPGLSLLMLANLSYAADPLCLQKEQEIQHEIDLAQKHNNQRRVNGLEHALSDTKADCTDTKLKATHQQKRVARQKERDKEKADGADKKKLAKRERKLQEAKSELKKVQAAPF